MVKVKADIAKEPPVQGSADISAFAFGESDVSTI